LSAALVHTHMMKSATGIRRYVFRNSPAVVAFAVALFSAAAQAAAVPSCAGNVEGENVQAVRVEKNGAVILDDGRALHPEGIILPAGAPDCAPDALVSQALGVITQLVHDKLVTFTAIAPKEDRYGRVRAQIFMTDNAKDPWLQTALLRRGLARVSLAPDRHECAAELLAAEAQARAAKTGLWAYPAYVVRTPTNVARDVGTFQVVEGKVVSAALRGGRAFLDFGSDWHTDFTVSISPNDMESFRAAAVDPRSFAGKTVRVRGWVESRDGPEIAVAVPESIEIIPDLPLRQSQ
jgi:micrococcal nuclease